MTIFNTEIAAAFYKLADLFEAQGANPYKIRAYRRAASVINRLDKELETLVNSGAELTDIPWIGKSIAAQIRAIFKTKKMPTLSRTEVRTPRFVNELIQVQGLGPKRIKLLKDLNIQTRKELKVAIKKGKLKNIKGFGIKIEKIILESLMHPKQNEKLIRLFHAMPVLESLMFHLKSVKHVNHVVCTGEYRRRKELVSSVVILLITSQPDLVFKQLILFPEIRDVIKQEKNSVQFYLQNIMQVTVLRVTKASFSAAQLFFTGSESHVNHLTQIAHQKKLELTSSGIFKEKKRIATMSEADIYKYLKLQFIEPELREDRGEIELAKLNKLPLLIKLENIKGDLHCHTNETDGREPLEVMVKAAIERGYEYISITDHSQNLRITNGMDAKRLLQQIKLIDRLNEKYEGVITILKSMEVDILEDGSLDLPNSILKELDLRVCSIHSKFRISKEKQTERIIRAMDNPYFTILGHATGRLINSRKPYELDIERIIQAAKERGCFLELNAQPYRLDIHDLYCKMAKEAGVKMAISSDAHSTYEMDFMKFGIYQARRGWLEAKDVINTRSLGEFKRIISR